MSLFGTWRPPMTMSEDAMLPLLATLSVKSSHRLTELALLAGFVGSLGLIGAALPLPLVRRAGLAFGGLLLAIAFALLIVAIHFGVSPYHVVKAK